MKRLKIPSPQKWLALFVALASMASTAMAQNFISQWNFENGDLSATLGGQPLSAIGDTLSTTRFGTTASLGLPDIGGTSAKVMHFPKASSSPEQGFVMPVGAQPNGGDAFAFTVNTYTLIMDVLFPEGSSGKKRGLLESADPSVVENSADAEWYVDAENKLNYKGVSGGTIAPNTWYRIALVLDFENRTARSYIDGQRALTFPIVAEFADGFWGLDGSTGVKLFTDDNDEAEAGYVNSIQLRDFALSDGQVAALGSAEAEGIPREIPPIPSFVTGWTPSGDFAPRTTALGVVIDAGNTTIADSSIDFTIDGNAIPGTQISRSGSSITLTAPNPGAFSPGSDHTIQLVYTDSLAGEKTFTKDFNAVIFYEDFEGVTLESAVEESVGLSNPTFFENAYTHNGPSGWEVDRSGVPGWDGVNFDNDGRTEWAGWSFANKDFWIASDNQNRDQFFKGEGVVAIADPDEWDDGPHAGNGVSTEDRTAQGLWYETYMSTPQVDLTGIAPGSVFLRFDSSWRDEFDSNYRQSAQVRARFDQGDWQTLFIWVSDPNSGNYKPESYNETVNLPLNNPSGAQTVQIEFGMFDAGNDWWWAIDNVVISAGTVPPGIASQPQNVAVDEGQNASFTVAATGTAPFSYQWFTFEGDEEVEIPGATNDTLNLTQVAKADEASYFVVVSNEAGEIRSGNASLTVQLKPAAFVILAEDFEGLDLGPNVDETVVEAEAWTDTPPEGWIVDDSGVPGAGDPANDGVTEWAGWSFAKRDFWNQVDGQRRGDFTKGTGTIVVADGDEWDDASHLPGIMVALLSTPVMDISPVKANSIVVQFDSSWRPEPNQIAYIQASIDGGEKFDILRFSSISTDPNFKDDNSTNETITVPVENPEGASTLQLTFGYEAGNNWWWAFDNLLITGSPKPLYSENFDSLVLGPNVDETVVSDNAFTKTPPTGWVVDNTNVPTINDPTRGVEEWEGWSFADVNFWNQVDGQRRTEFTKGTGVIAVADGDEWDDKGGPAADGHMNTLLTTPDISLVGVPAESVILQFDSSWRPENEQRAVVWVSFDGGEPIELLTYQDTSDDKTNETITLSVPNPEGASSMKFTFEYSGGNNWWWAIDNVEVNVRSGADAVPPSNVVIDSPPFIDATVGDAVFVQASADGDPPITFQWYFIPAGTDMLFTFPENLGPIFGSESVTLENSGTYYVTATNAGGTSESNRVVLRVIPERKPDTLLFEDFESLVLGPNVDETVVDDTAFTKTPPTGWTVDNSNIATINDPTRGVTEWEGWSFADVNFWNKVDGQRRPEFTKGTGTVAVADGDEWDDKGNPGSVGPMHTFLMTPEISLTRVIPGSVQLRFDSSWRPENEQRASVWVAFDGGEAMEVLAYQDTTDDKTNETIVLEIDNPSGASSMQVIFEYFGFNNWWWTIDNILVSAELEFETLYMEDFDSLVLGPNVDETVVSDNAFTKTPLTGWVVDNTNVPFFDDPTRGVEEWKGWSFADVNFWNQVDGQRRAEFTKGTGVIAVADGDEWDDKGNPAAGGHMNTLLTTPDIALVGVPAESVILQFDSSWRPENEQRAVVWVSFDGGEPIELLFYQDTSDDKTNETITLSVPNPEGASSMKFTFEYSGGNNWWWAIDNVTVLALPGSSMPGTVVFSSGLESEDGWTIVADEDTDYIFGYDYSVMGIPPAPHGNDTIGLRMRSNITTEGPGAASISASPNGVMPTGKYSVKFDFWLNIPWNNGTTESIGGAVGFDASAGAPLNGLQLIVNSDGDSSSDYQLRIGGALQGIDSGFYAIPSLNNTENPDVQAAFPGQSPPEIQISDFGQADITAQDGTFSFAWHTMEIMVDSDAGSATFLIDGFEFGTITGADLSGGIALTHTDPFGSVAGIAELAFGIFDNLVVTDLSGAVAGPMMSIGRNADGDIAISWDGTGTLQGAPTVNGPWTDVVGATSPFTTPAMEAAAFFRIIGGAAPNVTLNGANARPNPIDTSASGSGTVTLDGDQLTVNVSFSGLSAPFTAAHIHGPAGVEETAGVLINLASILTLSSDNLGGTFSGTLTVSPDTIQALSNGEAYINIHTSANPSGEIRGQVAL